MATHRISRSDDRRCTAIPDKPSASHIAEPTELIFSDENGEWPGDLTRHIGPSNVAALFSDSRLAAMRRPLHRGARKRALWWGLVASVVTWG
jgi:hypothetical protein